MKSGFTLIELSIVLVIIGLVAGGILTGRDMIKAAEIRAQISQIEKYHTAVHAFQIKYGYLPGDIPDPYASNFGFQSRGTSPGQGDGNGLIEGNCAGTYDGWEGGEGENAVFWEDLSAAQLIDATILGYDKNGINWPYTQGFNTSPTLTSTPAIKDWLPTAKIGTTNYVYTFSVNGINYFSVSSVTKLACSMKSTTNPGITVQQAYTIDSKADDGLPQSGAMMACYVNNQVASSPIWSAGANNEGTGSRHCVSTTTATPYQSYNCYDNNNTAGTEQYSLSQNANVQNCGLAFKFQ